MKEHLAAIDAAFAEMGRVEKSAGRSANLGAIEKCQHAMRAGFGALDERLAALEKGAALEHARYYGFAPAADNDQARLAMLDAEAAAIRARLGSGVATTIARSTSARSSLRDN